MKGILGKSGLNKKLCLQLRKNIVQWLDFVVTLLNVAVLFIRVHVKELAERI